MFPCSVNYYDKLQLSVELIHNGLAQESQYVAEASVMARKLLSLHMPMTMSRKDLQLTVCNNI